ncbi:ubiquitin carboxyl-terminal hydrolase [Diaporthe helianthi]|uniref:Ubiquitin carboxyl-terminal hydrolase n=1 Tax=Diaporthe helianthi TaxID=158607 RepID=A0A2P5HW57_DIAHE|nr:ubiquitin carboxyl-terminal hydrolase [Diaporthe helianthi]
MSTGHIQMDRASSSPDESRERAVSSEPCSTRPNPFDEDDGSSARKRRRTSLNGVSRSRSVESDESSHHSPACPADQDQQGLPINQDTNMTMDSSPSKSHTPDPQRQPAQPESESKPTKITLNLKSRKHVPQSARFSPTSPTDGDGEPDTGYESGIRASVEDPEQDVSSVVTGIRSPESSPLAVDDRDEPLVEKVDENDTSQLVDLQDIQLQFIDPMQDFPSGPDESLPDALQNICSAVPTSRDAALKLRNWIEDYLVWARACGVYTLMQNLEEHREFWRELPRLIWENTSINRTNAMRNPQVSRMIFDLQKVFTRLTAFFTDVDHLVLLSIQAGENTYQDLTSPLYILFLNQYLAEYGGNLNYADADPLLLEFMSGLINTFRSVPTYGSDTPSHSPCHLGRLMASLVPRLPRLIDHLHGVAQLAFFVLRDATERLHLSQPGREVEECVVFLEQGYRLAETMSRALEVCIEKSVNQIPADVAENLMLFLTSLLRLCLRAERGSAAAVVREHRRNHPDIAPVYSHDIIVDEWRLKTLTKFIMSSQMQLRLLAAQLMCQDLVRIFKDHQGHGIEPSQQPLYRHISNTLLQSGVVTYILGPTCHPEVTSMSGNIIGFLFASHTFTENHLDFMWQTMTTCQISGVSEGLSSMFIHIGHLFSADDLLGFCRKVQTVPIETFSPTIKDLCVAIIQQLCQKPEATRELLPYSMMFRLLRESSAPGPPFYQVIHRWAAQTVSQLLRFGPPYEHRALLYEDCLKDIAQKTQCTLGSIHGLAVLCRPVGRELHVLTSQHDLPRLLIDEFEHAVSTRQGNKHVIHGGENKPRLDMLSNIIQHQPEAISGDLGQKLWELLVGKHAASQEDRLCGWQSLNTALNAREENPFLRICFDAYLPTLAPEFFCEGSLEFALKKIARLVEDKDSSVLDEDDDENVHDRKAVEELWRIVLTAPTNSIEQMAIRALVKGVYIDSPCIQHFSSHRARKVHLALVNRCLEQLSFAAKCLIASGGEPDHATTPPGHEIRDQDLLFSRSLQVLRTFNEHYHATSQFSTPDMRSLVLPKTIDVQGESADLKFQSFDGDRQTEVKPLPIGKGNTAGSLLASIRDATGFDNYRLYYKGQALTPSEQDICRSLDELQICDGLILVKRESETIEQPVQVRPGASAVEIEILRHFEELWQFLGLNEILATEVYAFLITLPVDDRILATIEQETPDYHHVFPVDQPLKSLYAVHAIQEYLSIQFSLAKSNNEHEPYNNALAQAIRLVVWAISNPQVADANSSEELRIRLSTRLVEQLLSILKDPFRAPTVPECLDMTLLERLVNIMSFCMNARPTVACTNLLNITFQAILDTCSLRVDLWKMFYSRTDVKSVVRRLLLEDPRVTLRKTTALAIREKTVRPLNPAAAPEPAFRDYFWTLLLELIPCALEQPDTCSELFQLAVALFKSMKESKSDVLDLPSTIQFLIRLLLDYKPQEDIIQPGSVDLTAQGLVGLLHFIIFATQLFWQYLFPRRWSSANALWQGDVVYNEATRCQLINIILRTAGRTPGQLQLLIEDLRTLVSCSTDDDIEDGSLAYQYELPINNFERSRAIRSQCGYAGLRNLSNTCYLNSLCTQLFMNFDFRKFMLNTEVSGGDVNQSLLYHTQRMFGQLQSSHRRFIDPESFVASIKTYDDDLININNQMDVEEFFNLLNDRWEGQLRSEEATRRFRSFYGGQLVTQTKSKECEHLSEVLEPFSAIQCDIKGKKDLLESLNAYVDGEHMEGDNKYNCTTCGRHVDAVRRSCLKEVPDSLIFHLKRFDFNLRTLARNKINDYFAFPDRVDMRPFTIDHLSNPAVCTSEDWFELVGVLVHTGTAESGHYYSFIRERPTSRADQDWFEFNDDTVTPWNPAKMEASCYGGTEPSWDGSLPYEKNYCAYMLFYERSSTLQKKNLELKQSLSSSPVQAPMPAILASAIREDNLRLLQRHCLFDPHHIRLVDGAIEHMLEMSGGVCSNQHEMETSAVQMALGHFDQVAARAKDTPDAQRLMQRLREMAISCPRCAFVVYEYFSDRHESFRSLIQRNFEPGIRQSVSDLLMIAVQSIKETYPGNYYVHKVSHARLGNFEINVVLGVCAMFETLWDNFHVHTRSWFEVFNLMARFVDLGKEELLAFAGNNFLYKTLLIIVAESLTNQEMDQQFVRLSHTLNKRQNRPPSFSTILDLLNTVFASVIVDPPVSSHASRESLYVKSPDSPLRLTATEVNLLEQKWDAGCNIFLDKLIYINQNPEATDGVFASLLKQNWQFEEDILETILANTSVQQSFLVHAPYLRVAALYCRLSNDPGNIEKVIDHIARNSAMLANSEPRAVLGFFTNSAVIDGDRENSGETKRSINIQCLEYLPFWVPSLVAHYDHNISNEVKQVIYEKVFRHGTCPDFEEKQGGQELAKAVVRSAKRIGIECLHFVAENYTKRDTSVTAQTVVVLQSVLEQCGSFFDAADDEMADEDGERFFAERQVILDSLRRLSVDDIEDDGSDWENSVVSSDQMESLGEDDIRDGDA